MGKNSVVALKNPEAGKTDVLTEILRRGARQLLAEAVEAEVEAFLSECRQLRDGEGHCRVVRNGHLPEREVQTGIGAITVRVPRVRDRGSEKGQEPVRFVSTILPPYLRRAKSMEELIPWLYLKGISSGDFSEALSALLGPNAPGLSASTVGRLKTIWQEDYGRWRGRDLTGKRYVYFWADGVYFQARLEQEKQCILVIVGADERGHKELVGLWDGWRESEQSWKELLLDLKRQGLRWAPLLAVGDGALGFWKALPQVFCASRAQRCWMHKTGNVLNKLPRGVQKQAKQRLHEIWMAESKEKAEEAFDYFVAAYGAKYPKAVECLAKDRDVLLTFYDFPAEHWQHIRTTNPVESTFAMVRLRTDKTRGCLSRETALTMVFKLCFGAQKRWHKLNGASYMADVIKGVRFVDGIRKEKEAA